MGTPCFASNAVRVANPANTGAITEATALAAQITAIVNSGGVLS